MRSLSFPLAVVLLGALSPVADAQRYRSLPRPPARTGLNSTHVAPFPSRVFVPSRTISAPIVTNPIGPLPTARYYNPYLSYSGYNPYLHYYGPSYPYLIVGNYNPYYYGSSYPSPYTAYGSYEGYAETPQAYPPATTLALNRIVDVGLYENRYEPATLTISAGTTVRWTNYGLRRHTATSDRGLWDSGDLATGSSHSYTFTQSGKYFYYCKHHPDAMRGTIIVQ